jgi:DNA-binding NarL/FixJ family response regulator
VPDVVLLDLAMPELDGLECIPRMRAAVPDACILVLSGFQAARMAGPVMATGADGYLEKGVTLSVVRERILAGRDAPAVSSI